MRRVVVIGGFVTSTILTLLVIPTVYDVLGSLREALGRRRSRKGVAPNAAAQLRQ
jgi:hypothetical protein